MAYHLSAFGPQVSPPLGVMSAEGRSVHRRWVDDLHVDLRAGVLPAVMIHSTPRANTVDARVSFDAVERGSKLNDIMPGDKVADARCSVKRF
jgi:hypothetical protein